MMTSFLVLAEGGLTWTPETYYIVAAVVQLIVILLLFKVMNLRAEYNTFPHAAMVVIGTNLTAYFTIGFGLVGVLLTGFALFVLLAMMTRGDVIKSSVAWVVVMAMYWAVAMSAVHFEDLDSEELEEVFVQQFGPLPYALMEGGLDAEPMTRDDYERLRDDGGDEQ